MKFQLKVLAAALMLSAATVPAQAAIATAGTGSMTDTGDSSLVLTLVDSKDGISSIFNLGYTYSQFNTLVNDAQSKGGVFTWNIASQFGNDWNTFLTTAQAGNTSWAVYGGDNTGIGAGTRGMIMTRANVGSTSNANLSLTTQLTASLTNFDKYLKANSTVDSATATGGAAYAGTGDAYGGTGKVNGSGYDSTNPLDTSMSVLKLLSGASPTAAITTSVLGNSTGNYTFALSSAGILSFTVPSSAVTPVPEADTYALMLAGLALVSVVARRRKA